jgi:hypothetical protein
VQRNDPDWYAVSVMNRILGGSGQQSRLFVEIREKRGLAYGANSTLRAMKKGGLLIASTPQVDALAEQPENPFHEHEYSAPDFEALFLGRFSSVELLGQRRRQTSRHRAFQRADRLGLRKRLPFLRKLGRVVTGTAAMAEVSSEGVEIVRELDGATELIAVCRA